MMERLSKGPELRESLLEIITYINERARVNKSYKIPFFILGDENDVNEWDIEDNIDCIIPALPNQEMTQGNADNEDKYHNEIAEDMEVDDDPPIRQQLLAEEIATGQKSIALENFVGENVLNEEISLQN